MTSTLTPGQSDWRNFVVPAERSASAPPERRGVARDGVRLLVATPRGITHARFLDLPNQLAAGDLVVVNDSATLPAAVDVRRDDGRRATLHFSTPVVGGHWIVELRSTDRQRIFDTAGGERLLLPGGRTAVLLRGWPEGNAADGSRLWEASITPSEDVVGYLGTVGRPITYDHISAAWPLEAYQTIFAHHPGSAEMPSASRPFSAAVVAALARRGIALATITLHSGASSAEAGETPPPERFVVGAAAAARINAARTAGGRVIASGTTVTRALETVADAAGRVHEERGWTDLVLGDRPARAVDGVITGWHEPRSSHLRLLEAVAGEELTAAAYEAATAGGYLWHEFGDSCLLLPR